MKQVTAIDSPINGYVDGHCDGENLGLFRLSPGTLKFKNRSPKQGGLYSWALFNNSFDEYQADFYDPYV